MRSRLLVPFLLAAGVAAPAAAQVTVRQAPGQRAYAFSWTGDESPRAVIGVTTSTGEARDTLGLAVTDVAAGSPADKAGIKTGDRIQSVNGIDLKLEPIDVGDPQMADAMSRRLVRELGKLEPGDEVSLKVLHNGQAETMKVKTVDSGDLYGHAPGMALARPDGNRAMLGVSLGVTGSKRDTLGILVVGVDDSGPAARAGLEEGNRIAAINGVDLKVDRADAGDSYVANARYQRLQKEMAKVKPGDDVALQVYADGRFKTVHLKAGKASELGSGENVFIMHGDGGAPMMQFDIDRQRVMEQVQHAMDQAHVQEQVARAMDQAHVQEQVQRAMERVRQQIQRIRIETPPPRVRWLDDRDTPEVIGDFIPAPPAPALAPMPPMPLMAPSVVAAPAIAAMRSPWAAVTPRPAIAPPAPIRIIRF